MADMGDMINKILEDPQSMKAISKLLSDVPEAPPEKPKEKNQPVPDLKELEQWNKVLKKMNGPPDDRCRLLIALKPFVGPERRKKIDQSVQILKLMNLAESVGGLGIV